MAIPLATTGSTFALPARIHMQRTFPAMETTPVVKLNRKNVVAAGTDGAACRSAQVQRMCQAKLWSTAASTASAVASK